eukprot:SAG31_NODE_43346_length_267_cov_0.928571_1_plen_23_part_10
MMDFVMKFEEFACPAPTCRIALQ